MLVDTHSHLTDKRFNKRIRTIINAAKENGVGKIISVGTSVQESRNAIALSEANNEIFASVGLYPNDEKEENPIPVETRLKLIERLAKRKKVVAIGECGLDYSSPPPWEVQRSPLEQQDLFKKQIQIAKSLDLPVIIHSRKATEDTINVLREELGKGKFKAVWHCFTENADIATRVVSMGFMLSFTGIITYPSGQEIRAIVDKIPLENIMIETDSPYLIPEPLRSTGRKTNEPAYVKIIAEKIAEIKGISFEMVRKQTTKNAVRFFNV